MGFFSSLDGVFRLFIKNLTGNVGIGTVSPGVKLHVQESFDTVVLRVNDTNGQCDINPGSGADWSCTSDARLKDNIQDLGSSLDIIMQLQPRTFTMKNDDQEMAGFIAQEVLEVLPDMVDTSDPNHFKVSTGPLTPRIVKAIQEQQAQIEILKEENNALQEQNDLLKEAVCEINPDAEVCLE